MLERVLRHHKVQPALRLDERELDADLEHLPDGDVVGGVRLIRNPLTRFKIMGGRGGVFACSVPFSSSVAPICKMESLSPDVELPAVEVGVDEVASVEVRV